MDRHPRNDTRLALGMVAAVVVAAFAGWVLMPGGVPDWAPIHPLRDSSKATPRLAPPTSRIEAVEVASGTAPMVTLPAQTIPPGGVFFVDCATVRAAGATLHTGDAGYRPGLDRDGDGVACESTTPAAPSRPVVVAAQLTTPTTTRPRATTLPTSAPPPTPPSALLLSVATTAAPPPPPPAPAPAPVDVDGAPTVPPPPTTTTQPVLPPVYGSCDDAAADGRVPLRPGQPGWNVALDVDGDGLACEDDSVTLPTTPIPVPVVDLGLSSTTVTTTTTADNGR